MQGLKSAIVWAKECKGYGTGKNGRQTNFCLKIKYLPYQLKVHDHMVDFAQNIQIQGDQESSPSHSHHWKIPRKDPSLGRDV